MKKFLIAAAFLFVGGLASGQTIMVKSGDLSILKTPGVYTTVNVDWSATKIDGMPVNEYVKTRSEGAQMSWESDNESMKNLFFGVFTKKNKKGVQGVLEIPAGNEMTYMSVGKSVQTVDPSLVKYRITIKPEVMTLGNVGGMFVPLSTTAGGATMTGTLEISDFTTGEVLCVVEIMDFQGMNGYTEADRKNMVFYGIAADLCKMIKKGASAN